MSQIDSALGANRVLTGQDMSMPQDENRVRASFAVNLRRRQLKERIFFVSIFCTCAFWDEKSSQTCSDPHHECVI